MRKEKILPQGRLWKVLLLTMLFVFMLSANAMAKPYFKVRTMSLNVGQTKTVYLYNNNKSVSWSSTNSKVARITWKSRYAVKVKGIKKGSATIRAKIGRTRYSFRVTVKQAGLTGTSAKTIKKMLEKKFNAYGGIVIEDGDWIRRGNILKFYVKKGWGDGIVSFFLNVNLVTRKVTPSYDIDYDLSEEVWDKEDVAYAFPRMYRFMKNGFKI